MKMLKFFDDSHAYINKLRDLKDQANASSSLQCFELFEHANHIVETFFANAENTINVYENVINYTTIVKRLEVYAEYSVSLGKEVLREIYDCIKAGNVSEIQISLPGSIF